MRIAVTMHDRSNQTTAIQPNHRHILYSVFCMQDHIILDDCWHPSRDNTTGELVPFPRFFPDGMVPVIDYLHNLGIKFGLYTSVGDVTCHGGWSPGSLGHFEQDANTFAKWGVDYVKGKSLSPSLCLPRACSLPCLLSPVLPLSRALSHTCNAQRFLPTLLFSTCAFAFVRLCAYSWTVIPATPFHQIPYACVHTSLVYEALN